MRFKKIEEQIDNCKFCNLKDESVNVELGATYGYGGNLVMICGQAPSYIRRESKFPLSRDYEDLTVGVLFEVLDDIEWPISKTYFTNLMKCSTPGNRKPEDNEMDMCFNLWFQQELFLINPFAIVSLGRYVDDYLKKREINALYPIFRVDHFSYIARDHDNKYPAWRERWVDIKDKLKTTIKEFDVR